MDGTGLGVGVAQGLVRDAVGHYQEAVHVVEREWAKEVRELSPFTYDTKHTKTLISSSLVQLTVQHDIGIARQIDNSDRVLADLHADGLELITNVPRAIDTREQARLADDLADRDQLLAAMRTESTEAVRKVAAINARWSQLDDFKEPMGLHDALGAQKQRIAELMAQKDAMIEQLNEAVRAADRRYEADQLTQSGDIATLVDRIDSQVEVMREAYRQHLELLQRTVDTERAQFKRCEAQRWHALYADRDAAELAAMQRTAAVYEGHERELAAVTTAHRELNRATRIRLERDNDALQVQLQAAKADVLLNTEKLTYNHKVLQQRSEENVIVKAQQKRRLNRLHEVVAGLRSRLDVAVQQGGAEASRLTAEVGKLYANVMELDTKSVAIRTAQAQKYEAVWAVHEAECIQLLREFERIDRCINVEHLGQPLEVDRPTDRLIANKLKPSCKFPKTASRSASARTSVSGSDSTTQPVRSMDAQVVELILKKIATHTEWLQDSALFSDSLHFGMDDDVATARLVRIDHVFNALALTSAEHVQAVMKHFSASVFCVRCQARPDGVFAGQDNDTNKADPVSQHCDRHQYVIEESQVIPTLRTYVERFYQQQFGEEKNSSDKRPKTAVADDGNKQQLNPKEVEQFWQGFVNAVPAHRDRLWSALEAGMSKYLQVITDYDGNNCVDYINHANLLCLPGTEKTRET